jgi:hypothetical protein
MDALSWILLCPEGIATSILKLSEMPFQPLNFSFIAAAPSSEISNRFLKELIAIKNLIPM